MSLDFYLKGPTETRKCTCRECWTEHEYTTEPTLFVANITHNLGPMFAEAGVYHILWHGDGKTAAEVLPQLEAGLALMESDPPRFEEFNSPNGWGLYKNAVPFLREVIQGCRENPTGKLRCSR